MTNIIAFVLLSGQFQVSVQGPNGYLDATYEDTSPGVQAMFREVGEHLKGVPGRFFPCIVYEMPETSTLNSTLVNTIGPGTGYATSLIGRTLLADFRERSSFGELSPRIAEKACEHHFPADYKVSFGDGNGVLQIQWGKPIDLFQLLRRK